MNKKSSPSSSESSAIMGPIEQGMALETCHKCGCMLAALTMAEWAFSGSDALAMQALVKPIQDYKTKMQPIAYDCLGCKLCWGAEATRIIAETYGDSILECGDTTCAPHSAEGATVSSISSAKISWPPYPGDYVVGDPSGSIAVCTLASHDLTNTLMTLGEPGIAITGKCNTENIGVEKVVLNILTNPHIRWLILCGNEAEGHRPGDAFLKLKEHGVDAAIPRDPMVDSPAIPSLPTFERIEARAPKRLGLDPAGFFIILPNKMTGVIVCEHYENSGRLMHVIEGKDSALIAATAVERGLITRLDHAAYLGRELAKAEFTIRTGSIYTQDAALGELPQDEKCSNSTCKCH